MAGVVDGHREVGRRLAGTIEILVCDDGSTDGTGAALAAAGARTPELTVLRNETNLGIATTMKRLYGSARGEWIYFAPADGQDPAAALVARARRRRPRRRPSDPAARSGGARAHRRAVFGRPPANLPPAGWRGRRRGALPWPGAASLPCRGDFFEAEMLIARRTAHALGDLCSSGCAISFAAAELDASAALFVDRRRAVSPPARGRATRPRSRPAAASRTPRARPGARWMSHRPASGARA